MLSAEWRGAASIIRVEGSQHGEVRWVLVRLRNRLEAPCMGSLDDPDERMVDPRGLGSYVTTIT